MPPEGTGRGGPGSCCSAFITMSLIHSSLASDGATLLWLLGYPYTLLSHALFAFLLRVSVSYNGVYKRVTARLETRSFPQVELCATS